MNTTQAPPFHVPHTPQKNKKCYRTTFCSSHKQILQRISILLLQGVFRSSFKMLKSLLIKVFFELLSKMQVKSWKITWSASYKKNHIVDASSKMHFKCSWNSKILSTKALSVILKELPNDLIIDVKPVCISESYIDRAVVQRWCTKCGKSSRLLKDKVWDHNA